MERVQDNKQSSLVFEQLFKQHYRTLCFHAMSLVNDLDASKDIVHDVFLSLWYHRASIDFTRPVFPYLFSLTRNRALNYLEHKKIQNNHVRQHLADDPTYTLSDDSTREELLEHILARIELLPERCSQVMKLCFIECKKYKEIAEELNISVNTVKTHITTGLKNLTGRISRFSLVASVLTSAPTFRLIRHQSFPPLLNTLNLSFALSNSPSSTSMPGIKNEDSIPNCLFLADLFQFPTIFPLYRITG